MLRESVAVLPVLGTVVLGVVALLLLRMVCAAVVDDGLGIAVFSFFMFLWVGGLCVWLSLQIAPSHFTEEEQVATHAEHTRAVADEFADRAGGCAERANELAQEGQQLLLGQVGTDDGRAVELLRRVNDVYHTEVRCLLTQAQRMMPASPLAVSWARLTPGEGSLFCLNDHTAQPPRDVHQRMAAEQDAWGTIPERLGLTAAPDEEFRYLTDSVHFPPDMDRLFPFFSPTGTSAWVAYSPDTDEFTVNTPTVEQLVGYCETITS